LLQVADLLLDFSVSARQLGGISIGVVGDSAAAGDQGFANCRGAVCANGSRTGRSLLVMRFSTIVWGK
jgi:hypothetical protein